MLILFTLLLDKYIFPIYYPIFDSLIGKKTLQAFELPVLVKGLDKQAVVETTKNDKKMDAGKIKFILLDGIGHAVIDSSVTREEMLEGFQYVAE